MMKICKWINFSSRNDTYFLNIKNLVSFGRLCWPEYNTSFSTILKDNYRNIIISNKSKQNHNQQKEVSVLPFIYSVYILIPTKYLQLCTKDE